MNKYKVTISIFNKEIVLTLKSNSVSSAIDRVNKAIKIESVEEVSSSDKEQKNEKTIMDRLNDIVNDIL